MNRFKLNTEERNRILNLHESVREKTIKKIILEAGPYEDGEIPVPNTVTTVPTTGTPATPGTPAGPGLSGFNADSDGVGAYIAKWEYSKPIPSGLTLGKPSA
jgi:hypothetical protein